jgi:hypothetical protein
MSKFLIDSTGEITECTNIFERYLSRNAIEQVNLLYFSQETSGTDDSHVICIR